ncbi:hypothetical protein SSP24_78500 [Streptomyces spinoverrucosus]|uniref:Luciferase-like domain-containing protein n=2 Tax=Streptomyces spinoverrucosus TaxID=284043 RepID=A0A4Y3VVQ3_9ACTN|nr:hypothetical protein SSP24_78500 [Streptomyces spinoverrucosus]GHB98339.1 hypothetical protein GCM10010397_83520 [Streptomyces spinoverrucosus]
MLAKTAASLDLLSAGRFELGIGSGGYWSAIARMAVTPQLGRAEALARLEEAVHILRALWRSAPEPVTSRGPRSGRGSVSRTPFMVIILTVKIHY